MILILFVRWPSTYPGQSSAPHAIDQRGASFSIRHVSDGDEKFRQFSFFIAVIANPSSHQVSPAQFKISVQPPGSVTLLPCEATPSPDGLRVLSKKSDTMDSYFEVCPGTRGRGASNGTVLQVSVERCSGNTDLYACDSDPSAGGTNCFTGMPRPEMDDWAYRSRSNGNETCARRFIDHARWSQENCTALPKGEHKPTLFLPYNSNSSNEGNYNIMTRGNGTFEMTVSDNSGRAFKVVPFNASDHGREVIVLGGVRGSPGTPYVVTGPVTLEWHPSILIEPFQGKAVAASVVHQAYLVDLDEKTVHHKEPNPHLHTYCGLSLAVSTLPASVITVVPLKVAIESSVPTQSAPVPDLQARARVRVHAEKASVSYTFNSNILPPNRKYSITVVALCDSACLKAADPKGPCRTGTCRTQTYVYAPVVVMSVVPSIPPSASTSTTSILMAFTFWVVVIALIFLLATGLKVLHDKGVFVNTFGYSPRDQSLSTPYVDALGGDGGRGRRWTWGYTQLGFTEMVNTSTFGSSRGISLRGVDGSEGEGERQGDERVIDEVQPARQHMAANQASRLLANISDGTAAMAASAASLTAAAGSALSDTASALLSHFGAGSGGRERTRGRESSLTADMDSSTHPLTGGRRSRNRGGYRPPSPIPTTDKETSSDTSNPIHPSPFKPVSTGSDEVCIDLTDIQSQSRARDSPLYTSFPTKNEGEKPLDEE